eukprot:TRINITY_DN4718_c0_g1_i2.p1 TRINITY_DN4718_c0_g1~~TRINITY_DN4718_c0_g1_i2.p1  ORF type:complete len:259 (-),score=43.51 TRINITY_DN4718_c0_g1_i2:420-1145(-)
MTNDPRHVKNTIQDKLDQKVFMGGLSWETTENSVIEYFQRVEIDVESVVIMRDKDHQSRGFGFLLLRDFGDFFMLEEKQHWIDGRLVVFKRAVPEDEVVCTKLFVGGLPLLLTEDLMRDYFSAFGSISECLIMKDRYTGRPRGFGFVSFVDSETVDHVLSIEHVIGGKKVELKLAESKVKSRGTPKSGKTKIQACPSHIPVYPQPVPYMPVYPRTIPHNIEYVIPDVQAFPLLFKYLLLFD